MNKNARTLIHILFSVTVIAALSIPLGGSIKNLKQIDTDFFGKVELVTAASNIRFFALKDRLYNKTIVGEDGWLIHASDMSTNDYQRSDPLTQEELQEIEQKLRAAKEKLDSLGIKLYIVAAPNKNTIYPEKLPSEIKVLGSETRLDQLTAHLHASLDVPFLDLRQSLTEARQDNKVFYQTDTHWNSLGAFIAYREIAGRLSQDFPAIVPYSLDQYEQTWEQYTGDMTKTMGNVELPEKTMVLKPRFEVLSDVDNIPTSTEILYDSYVISTHPNQELPTAVFYRDSFFKLVLPFLAEHFSHTESFWTYNYDMQRVFELKPDLVVIEFTERSIHQLLNWDGILD